MNFCQFANLLKFRARVENSFCPKLANIFSVSGTLECNPGKASDKLIEMTSVLREKEIIAHGSVTRYGPRNQWPAQGVKSETRIDRVIFRVLFEILF